MSFRLWMLVSACGSLPIFWSSKVLACGCLAPTSPATPVVQAGERIAFSYEDGIVTAHIQIQYQGEASEFGWLLPLPSVPEFSVGSEELFDVLEGYTQPSFEVSYTEDCPPVQSVSGSWCGGEDDSSALDAGAADAAPGWGPGAHSPLIRRAEAGPFEYAVLDAGSKEPMFGWLSANGYFVPAQTEDSVGPYIHPGAYFLALKLRAGQSAGDIQPVVVRYPAQYPMVPIILTKVGATPEMGILVYVFGAARAIPRNYQHLRINPLHLDYQRPDSSYAQVLKKAIDESADHHAFVTEYSGSTEIMRRRIDSPGRYDDRGALEKITSPLEYLQALRQRGFRFDLLEPILSRVFRYPAEAQEAGIDEQSYYAQLDSYLQQYDPSATFSAAELTAEIWERIVTPALGAARLLNEHSVVTRFMTFLSPEEMTADPVFAQNPELPPVDRVYRATFRRLCTGARLLRVEGRYFPANNRDDLKGDDGLPLPWSERIEILREEGPPEIVVDHRALMSRGRVEAPEEMAAGEQETSCAAGGAPDPGAGFLFLSAMFWLLRRRARPGS